MTIRGALIGCGYASRFQLKAWSQIEDVEIVAVSSRNQDQAQARATEFSIPAFYTDYRQMLDDEMLDFIDIATPPSVHLEMVKASAERGLHVLCQKPIAETLSELREMIQICEDSGVNFTVNENGRFQPWFRKMKSLIEAGAIGHPFYSNFTSRWRGALEDPPFQDQPFFATMPRLIIYELGVHFLDTLRYLFGEANSVFARKARISPAIQGEDLAIITLDMDDLLAVVDLSWASLPAKENAKSITWGEVVIEGDAGTLSLTMDGHLHLHTMTRQQIFAFPDHSEVLGYQNAQQHFIDSLRSKQEAEISGREMVKTMELVFGAYDSATNGTNYRVTLDIERLA
jgi:D-apiose dehydrogenase